MNTQRRTSTSSPGGATPGRDDDYPTDTFDSVVGSDEGFEDTGWDELVSSTSPAQPQAPAPAPARPAAPSRAPEDDERPTQVFGVIRDEPEQQRPPVAEQLFGGTAVPEEDDTAVFARYRDGDPDPRASQGTAAVRDDAHTEQFAAYQDEAYGDTVQTPGAGAPSWSGPAVVPVPVPGPMVPPIPPIPTGLGKQGGTKEPLVPEVPGASGGKRALREPVAPGAQASPETDANQAAEATRNAPEAENGPDGPAQTAAEQVDESAGEPVLDKKIAKRLAKERGQAAKDAAKAEKSAAEQAAKSAAEQAAKAAKSAAEQAAKDEKAAAKAAKKSGRGRGAAPTEDVSAAAEGVGASQAPESAAVPGAGASAASPEAPAGFHGLAATSGAAGADDGRAGADQPAPVAAAVAQPAVARRKAPVLVVLLLLFIATASGAAAWLFQQQATTASKQRPSSNIALLDKSATVDVIAQISKAVEAIYTYDSSSLDRSESLALSQITGSYESDFKDNFAAVRALPPEQRASLTSKVVSAGVITLTERRANLLVMLDQVGRRGDNVTPVQSEVRLSVTAQRVDGQWKVSDISQR